MGDDSIDETNRHGLEAVEQAGWIKQATQDARDSAANEVDRAEIASVLRDLGE